MLCILILLNRLIMYQNALLSTYAEFKTANVLKERLITKAIKLNSVLYITHTGYGLKFNSNAYFRLLKAYCSRVSANNKGSSKVSYKKTNE